MRRLVLITCLLLCSAGCQMFRPTPTVHHLPVDAAKTGEPLSVVVTTRRVKAETQIEGAVHYRLPGYSRFSNRRLERRSGEMWAALPTNRVRDGERVAYFIDVTIDGEEKSLGSAMEPFTVRFVDREKFALREVEPTVKIERAGLPLRFELEVGSSGARDVELTYERPGMPGAITVPMKRKIGDRYVIEVPATRVSGGQWRYFMTVNVEGRRWRLPAEGWRTFVVPGG